MDRRLGLSQWQLLFALTLSSSLGCFLDGISMVVLTTAIIMPLVEKAGFDLIWFGIYLVLVVEMAQITPPVGFNLFVLQGLTGRSIFAIGLYALPLFLLMCVAVVLIAAFPEIALWLPSTMLDFTNQPSGRIDHSPCSTVSLPGRRMCAALSDS
jgi:C4-dicarboxylate transporter, DctM subunit